jgi:hypothetical protein
MPDLDDKGGSAISNRSILTIMAVLVAAGTVLGFIAWGTAVGLGVLFGGLLGFVNYFWLDRSTRSMFQDGAAAAGSLLAIKYIGRYLVMGAILFAVYATGIMPVEAVIAGLGAFAVAVVIQGLASIFINKTS